MYTEEFNYPPEMGIDTITTDVIYIDTNETHQLATHGFIMIKGRKYFRRCGYDSIIQARNGKQPNDIIVQNSNRVFLLTPHQNEATPVRPGLAAY